MVTLRSIWSGVLDVGGLNVPVKLGSSTTNSKSLRMVRVSDGAAIKFLRHAEGETEEVPWNEIGKGYDAPDGSLVILSQDEQKAIYGEKNRVAKIREFTDASQIPPMAVKSSYWVQPDTNGAKGYAMLAEALAEAGTVAVVEFSVRQNNEIAVLRPIDGYLALETLEWDADMIRPDFAAPVNTADDRERELVRQLVTVMTEKYDHAAQTDTTREALMAAIQAKIDAGDVVQAPAPPGQVSSESAPIDFAARLQAAVEAKKGKDVPKPRTRQASARKKASA